MAGSSCILAISLLSAAVSAIPSTKPINPCAVVRCEAGTVCKVQTVKCVKAPCPKLPRCVPTDKPGSCPKPVPGLFGICIARCSTDADCDGDQKCCGSCPRQCTRPVLPRHKPGTCPWFPKPHQVYCTSQQQCNSDFDCGGRLKCCGSCPRRCVKPSYLNMYRG
ncbi:perlwapin-like isoform X1 [Haliotis asinina]|uniref:perlwapin-like isoform X1 n=1 Tax=Haliotis asinina TaxID=109174 RepID=UPI00353203FC